MARVASQKLPKVGLQADARGNTQLLSNQVESNGKYLIWHLGHLSSNQFLGEAVLSFGEISVSKSAYITKCQKAH